MRTNGLNLFSLNKMGNIWSFFLLVVFISNEYTYSVLFSILPGQCILFITNLDFWIFSMIKNSGICWWLATLEAVPFYFPMQVDEQ